MKVIFHEAFYEVYAMDPAAEAGRMEAVVEVIEPKSEFIEAKPASESDINSVHTKRHIDQVRRYRLYDAASLAVGGAIMAAELGLKEPCFGLIRPPGHHASPDGAWGFCYFNNMAIAIEHLKSMNKIDRAYVLDIDLHFGDGTVNIFKDKGYVNVQNISARGRESYLKEVENEMQTCEAEIIGISAGFDNHEDDWGGTLSTEDYRQIGLMVREAAKRLGAGCFALLEGGYNHSVLGHNVLSLMEGLSGAWA